MQDAHSELLTARQVHSIFGVDRSTVYRMAERGELPAVKIGRQWRFPADEVERLAAHQGTAPRPAAPANGSGPAAPLAPLADAVLAVAADLLGVTMVATDMQGRPVTGVANPCARLTDRAADASVLADCMAEWRQLADEASLEPRFQPGPLGFECARAFVRSGTELIAMVVAGGVAREGDRSPDLHHLDDARRAAVLTALPEIAATLSRAAAGRPSAQLNLTSEPAGPRRAPDEIRVGAGRTVEVEQ